MPILNVPAKQATSSRGRQRLLRRRKRAVFADTRTRHATPEGHGRDDSSGVSLEGGTQPPGQLARQGHGSLHLLNRPSVRRTARRLTDFHGQLRTAGLPPGQNAAPASPLAYSAWSQMMPQCTAMQLRVVQHVRNLSQEILRTDVSNAPGVDRLPTRRVLSHGTGGLCLRHVVDRLWRTNAKSGLQTIVEGNRSSRRPATPITPICVTTTSAAEQLDVVCAMRTCATACGLRTNCRAIKARPLSQRRDRDECRHYVPALQQPQHRRR
jgi:hypothetical protein